MPFKKKVAALPRAAGLFSSFHLIVLQRRICRFLYEQKIDVDTICTFPQTNSMADICFVKCAPGLSEVCVQVTKQGRNVPDLWTPPNWTNTFAHQWEIYSTWMTTGRRVSSLLFFMLFIYFLMKSFSLISLTNTLYFSEIIFHTKRCVAGLQTSTWHWRKTGPAIL